MARFLDGPAQGVVLCLQRAPVMLRVVQSGAGAWDALDQPTDEARPEELIFVYRMVGEPIRMHVCRSPRRLSGWITEADYRYLTEQPADEHLRKTSAWQRWCDAQAHHDGVRA